MWRTWTRRWTKKHVIKQRPLGDKQTHLFLIINVPNVEIFKIHKDKTTKCNWLRSQLKHQKLSVTVGGAL